MEHALDSGWPDWYYVMRRQPGWLEAKIAPESGRPPDHLTVEQVMWAEEEVRWGGRWHLLALRQRSRTWLLYDAPGARAWLGGQGEPLLAVRRAFPTKEIMDWLAPSLNHLR